MCKKFANAFSTSIRPFKGLKSAVVAVFETFVASGGGLVFNAGAPPLCFAALRTADEFSIHGASFVGER